MDRALSRFVAGVLERFSDLDVRDYAALLQLKAGYGVAESQVPVGHWVADRLLEHVGLRGEGIAVLGIEQSDGSSEGVPTRSSIIISVGDILVLYGQARALTQLGERQAGQAGDNAHAAAVEKRVRSRPANVSGGSGSSEKMLASR